jgi:N-methylhydantoinase A
VAVARVSQTLSVDMQFVGQTHLVRVALDTPEPDKAMLRRLFDEAYFRRFRVRLETTPVNLVNVNTSVIGTRPEIDLAGLVDPAGRATHLSDAETGKRRVWFESGWRDTPVYARERMPADAGFEGPAIVEQMDATLVVEPGDRVTTDADGNLHILVAVG